MNTTVGLWLEGPLQSWGCTEESGHHSTLGFPSKSGVIGIILAAMGNDGSDNGIIGQLADCQMTAYCFEKTSNPMILSDFHTAGAGWDKYSKEYWEAGFKRRNRKGDLKPEAMIMRKDYLQDMAFGVLIEGDEKLISSVGDALKEPVWPLFLGRKACTPSEPVYLGVGITSDALISKAVERKHELKEIVKEGRNSEAYDSFAVRDVPVSYYPVREFRERWVSIEVLN